MVWLAVYTTEPKQTSAPDMAHSALTKARFRS